VKRRDDAEAKRSIQQVAFERTEARIKEEMCQLRESTVGVHDISIDSVQFALDETTSTIQVHESQLKNVKAERDSALAELKAYTLLVAPKELETSQVVYQDLCSLVKDSDS
jgi:hypothetical protein